MSPIALGTFNAPINSGKASSFDPRPQYGNVGKPLIVVCREYKENFVTPKFPTPKNVVIVDVVDLSPLYAGGEAIVLPSVIWGAGAVVDRIRKECQPGEAYPMKLITVNGSNGPYASIVGLQTDPADAEMLARAVDWDTRFGIAYVDHCRAQKQAADAAAAAAAPAQPAWGQQPQAPAANGWGQQPAAPAQNGWGAPQGQPAAPAWGAPQGQPQQPAAAPTWQQPAAAAPAWNQPPPVQQPAPVGGWQQPAVTPPSSVAGLDNAIAELEKS